MTLPPLSLYVHMPWCVRKCPYCDFNSHSRGDVLPEAQYIQALLQDLDADLNTYPSLRERTIRTVFIGGGTPSLISAQGYQALFAGVQARLAWAADAEVTLEANPGTVEQGLFAGYREAGINRLSIGVQSFNAQHLQALGRIHQADEAIRAAQSARAAGFDTFNIDLMHGLPGQSVQQAMADLQQAIELAPTHLSWYQLTIEPNTVFYRQQPVLPDDEVLADIQDAGMAWMQTAGYDQYEVSAYARLGHRCRHNLNYWQFGDYIGLGAGAHGKVTVSDDAGDLRIWRTAKTRAPKDYLAAAERGVSFCAQPIRIADDELPFEFMLNALRLLEGVPRALWHERTGLADGVIAERVQLLQQQGLLLPGSERLQATPLGQRFLNRAIDSFLTEST